MNDKEFTKDPSSCRGDQLFMDERCGDDRRRCPSEGFSYVSMVGWICRREKTRRNNDEDGD